MLRNSRDNKHRRFDAKVKRKGAHCLRITAYRHCAEGGRSVMWRTVGSLGCGRYGLVLKGRGGGVPETL